MGEMLLNGRLYGASGIRELTQAQYDALPASKLTDGILYCIKDTGIVEGDKYAPVIYSLEEREIGVWTDGKPLYQKTITGTTDSSSNTTQAYNLATNNIQTVVSCVGYVGWTNSYGDNAIRNLSGYADSNAFGDWGVSADGTKLLIFHGNYMRGKSYVITLQYTKTTDVPGSGTWGTDGVPMVHYDGNEKVIGTWFGETLYEKTFTIPISSQTGDITYAIDSGLSVVNAFGIIKTVGGFKMVLPASYSDIFYCGLQHDSNYIRLSIYSSSDWRQYNTLTEAVVTIQYTKTS